MAQTFRFALLYYSHIMSKYYPLIGIPCRSDNSGIYAGRPINALNSSYTNAVIAAGGLPIMIPLHLTDEQIEQVFNQVDGLLFSGGGDIEPSFYNETPQVDNLSDVEVPRDTLEIKLMQLAVERKKPFFGICRGIQVMNVANGGNLWQDVARQNHQAFRHDFYYSDPHAYPRNHLAHEVMLEKSSLIHEIVQTDYLVVNSLHHQAAKDVPDNLKITGQSEDNAVEVLEVIDHPFGLGVQWHPEELVKEHESARQMFAAFVEATRQHVIRSPKP